MLLETHSMYYRDSSLFCLNHGCIRVTFSPFARFLFSLPKSIAQNIESGDIDMVVSDYERTKSLFTGGEVQVFQKVLLEVTRLVADFRRELRSRLTELPSCLEDQRRMIKFLIQLDYSGDPGWEALEHMYRWIINLVEVIRDRYQTIGSEPIPLSELHSAGLQHQVSTQGIRIVQWILGSCFR